MSHSFRFSVNGETHTVDTDPERPLLDVLREDLGLLGTKYGCGEGQCRACTVLLDGRPITSCITPVSEADGKAIITIEGLENQGALSVVQQAFLDEDAMQCGYCVPGMILTATGLLASNPTPTDEEIVAFMNGNLCRCSHYTKILAAIRRAASSAEEASTR